MLDSPGGPTVFEFQREQRELINAEIRALPDIPSFDAALAVLVRHFLVDPPILVIPTEIEPASQQQSNDQLVVEYRFELRGDCRLTDYSPPSLAYTYSGARWNSEKGQAVLRMPVAASDPMIAHLIRSEIDRMRGNFAGLNAWYATYNANLPSTIEPLLRQRATEIRDAREQRLDLRIRL